MRAVQCDDLNPTDVGSGRPGRSYREAVGGGVGDAHEQKEAGRSNQLATRSSATAFILGQISLCLAFRAVKQS
jgi:hypothetical protein